MEVVFTGAVDKFDWQLITSYLDALDGVTGDSMPNIPHARAKFSVNYAIDAETNVNLNGYWVSKRPRPVGDDRDKVSSHTIVNLSLLRESILSSLDLQATFYNLFDTMHVDPDTSGALQFVDNDFPREGRSLYIKATYHLE